MPITAIPQDIKQQGADTLFVIGVLTDGATFKQQFETTFRGATTLEQARQQFVSLLASNQSQAALLEVLKVGQAFDLTAPVAPPPDPPSDADKAKSEYFAAVSRLQQYRVALSADNKALTDQQTLVESLFKVEYYG